MSLFFNKNLRPMLLKEVEHPFNDKKCIFEMKFDGIRALIHVNQNRIMIINRNGNIMNDVFPELLNIKNSVNQNVIFDGEIVILENGKPSFKLLQKRNMLKDKAKINYLKEEYPVTFVVFDIIYESKDLTKLSLMERKNILNKYKDNEYFVKTRYIEEDGINYFNTIKKNGLEGIVAKRKDSAYYPNKRTDIWLKIKNQKDEDFYICGYLEGKGSLSSLLLGIKENEAMTYIGKVTIGKRNPDLKEIKKYISVSNKKILYHNHNYDYVKPILKCTVNFIEKTSNNSLRQPIYKTLK